MQNNVLKRLRALQENTEKQFKKSGRQYKNKIKSSTERENTKRKEDSEILKNTLPKLKNSTEKASIRNLIKQNKWVI